MDRGRHRLVNSRRDHQDGIAREGIAMNLREEFLKYRTRRQFFKDCGVGLGTVGLASLLNERLFAADQDEADNPLAPKKPHFPAKAKNVIYLHMAGSPSTLDLFDYKPSLQELNRH